MHWSNPVVTAAATVLILLGGAFGISALTGTARDSHPSATQEKLLSSDSADTTLPPATVASLETDEIYVEPMSEETLIELGITDAAALDAQAAMAINRARIEVPLVENAPASAVPQRFTDSQYGQEKAPNDNAASNVEPFYVDRPAWVVTFQGVEVPVLGPNVDGVDRSGQVTQTAKFVVFLDVQTYEFLEAVTAAP